ncbi:MAG TPA: polysaccharide biosynthesis tyrosine autokinase [Phycisphaerales bacterium]|nr:polysaccharide biosynthesis tyrosine autokinase [Phycisphaerales bacterium]
MDNGTIGNGSANTVLSEPDGPPQESLLFIVLRHRWTILITTLVALVAAFAYILKATPIYESESRLYVEQSGPRIINEYEGVMARSGNYLYTQGELLRSTPVIGPVVDDPKIARLRTFADVDNHVAFLRQNLTVNIGRKDDVITVSLESPYPVEAAQIVNELVRSYIAYHAERKRDTASEVLKILQKEKESRDKYLTDKLEEMIAFTEENGIVSFDDKGGNIVFEMLRTLSTELSQAEMAAMTAKTDFDAIMGIEDDPFKIKQFAAASTGSGVRMPVADREMQLRSELRQAETELKDILYLCTEEHPSVQAIKSKIDRINKELEEEAEDFAEAYVEVMRLRWVTAKQREDDVRASFESQYNDAKGFGVLAARYSLLQSELSRAERICEIVDNRIKELNVTAQDVESLRISILEVARAADRPSKPQKAKVMAMALALGLLMGGGLAFLRDWLDFRLRSSEEVSAILGIPVLGVVPKMGASKVLPMRGHKPSVPPVPIAAIDVPAGEATASSDLAPVAAQDAEQAATETRDAVEGDRRTPSELESVRWVQRMSKKAGRSARGTTVGGASWDKSKTPVASAAEKPDIVRRGQKVHLESKSVVAEAYRTIRTAVFFGAPKEGAKTILITSPAPGDGKSTLASNIAISMAQAGQKTLLIDADFRKPVQHKIFEVDDNKGVSSVLAGRDTIEQAIQPGVIDSLDVMACGPEVPNPSELLNSDVFTETLVKLTEQYDRVVVDSPPVGPVADAQILSTVCDITVLVLRAEKSTRRQAQHARDSLLSVGARLLGAVVNDVQQKRGQYGYYSSYGNYGYYGKREKKTG